MNTRNESPLGFRLRHDVYRLSILRSFFRPNAASVCGQSPGPYECSEMGW